MPHGQTQLCATATIESFGQMFEREIVNADDNGTRTKGRRGELHVQHVNRMFTKFCAECQRDSDQRRVGKGCVNFEVGPALVKSIVSFGCRDVECVLVNAIDLG